MFSKGKVPINKQQPFSLSLNIFHGGIFEHFFSSEIFTKQYLPGCFDLINVLLGFLSSAAAIPLAINH